MSYSVISEDKQTMHTDYVVEFVKDLEKITDSTKHDMALCLEDKKIYIKKSNGRWEVF